MNILSTIRNRAGMFVLIVVGLALLAFVAEGLITKMSTGGGSAGPETVAEINGVSISREEYDQVYSQYMQNQSGENAISQAHQGAWSELLDKYVYGAEYDKLGITVTDKELAAMLYSEQAEPYIRNIFTDPQTGRLFDQYATPDGRLNMAAVRTFASSIQPNTDNDRVWANVEKSVRRSVLRNKYTTLVRKGMYVTRAEARRRHNEENTLYTFRYVYKAFGDIADSTIKVTDAELQKYYDEHQYLFRQQDETRDIEYVSFDVNPTEADAALIAEQFKKVGDAWVRMKTVTEDTTFVRNQSEDPRMANVDYKDFGTGTFPAGKDSLFIKAADNSIIGPERNGEQLNMYKVVKHLSVDDSARARHILIGIKTEQNPGALRTKDVAKKLADSIVGALKKNTAVWNDLCVKYSEDPGSSKPDAKGKNKYGDYGWLNSRTQFVKPYLDFALQAKKGDIEIVESQFGYHVMEKLESSKTNSQLVRTLLLTRNIVPSQATYNAINAQALDFAGKNNTAELFDKAVKDPKKPMQVQVAADKKGFDFGYSGLTSGKALTQWLYKKENKVGMISEPIHLDRHYVVAKITKIVPEGFKPFTEESVRKICEVEVRKQKKADMIMADFKKGGNTLDGVSAALKKPILTAANVNFNACDISGVGSEAGFVGYVSTLAKGAVSKPYKGELGIFMAQIDNITLPTQPLKDEAAKQRMMSNDASGRSMDAMDKVLREKAEITDDRAWATQY